MKKNKTDVVFCVDRSGSMGSIKDATQKGFADFIAKQKNEPGECYVSLYQFDDRYDTVFECKNVNDVGEYDLVPRGWTALLDAIGFTINKVGERLNNTPESERPELVIFTVLTDGFENRSKEFTKSKIKEMVEHQTNKYNWKFIFLGCNQDAVLTGESYGFSKGLSMTYNYSASSAASTFEVLSTGVLCLRSCVLSGAPVNYNFSNEQRNMVLSK